MSEQETLECQESRGPEAKMPLLDDINHLTFITADMDRLLGFYERVFGARTTVGLEEAGRPGRSRTEANRVENRRARKGAIVERPVTGERITFRQIPRDRRPVRNLRVHVRPHGFVVAPHLHPHAQEANPARAGA